MKKKKIKLTKLFKISVIFFGISLFLWNCEKENDLIEPNLITHYEPSINYLSGKDVPQLIRTIASKSGSKVSYKSENISINTPFGIVTFDKIMEVIDSIGNKNYTFNIQPKNFNDKVFYNLVVNADSKEPFIYEYEMSDSFHEGFKNKILTMHEFSGTIRTYKLDGISLKNKSTSLYDSCPKEITIESGEDNIGTTNTGGGNLPDGGTTDGSSGGNTGSGSGTGNTGGITYPDVPCRLVITYNSCSVGGAANGHGPACQHSGGIHDQPGNEDPCDHRCSGSSLNNAYLTGDCGRDDAADTHNSSKTSTSCPDNAGEIGVIIPDEVEVMLTKLRIELNLNLEENTWVRENPDYGVIFYHFLENYNWDLLSSNWVKGQIELETNNPIKWKLSSGKIAGLEYTHSYIRGSGLLSYFKLTDGSILAASSEEQTLTTSGELKDKYPYEADSSGFKYYYIKLPDSNEWAEMLYNPRNTKDELETLFKLAGLELGKNIGRYVLPIEDIKILIDGKDFDGQEVSRWKAAGFLILAVVPGSKALKVVGNVADATVFATKVGSKTIVVKGIQGLRSFTSTNFRHNLSKITKTLPSNSQAHHVLPQKFRSLFEKAKINIDNPIFGAWWEKTDHLNNAWKYNDEWSNFFNSNQNPSQEKIFEFARDLMSKYGIQINF